MPEMFEELELSIGPLRQYRCAEWLHNFLDSHGLAGKMIFGRAWSIKSVILSSALKNNVESSPDETKSPHSHRLQICISVVPSALAAIPSGFQVLPARNLKGRAKDLGADEFGHVESF
jgi:hypothetical protein